MTANNHKITKGSVCWTSPSNIAFVKYWGKKEVQIPCNPSLSMTLKKSYTKTQVMYQKNANPSVDVYFENKKAPNFEIRIQKYIQSIQHLLPFLKEYSLQIETENTFPHSTGIASSASAFSALALCLCSIEQMISNSPSAEESFFRKASELARLGSGSACRSVYGKYAIWGRSDKITNSHSNYAIPFSVPKNSWFNHLKDAILIVDSNKKSVSSTAGHQLMNNHPFASSRFLQAEDNTHTMIQAIAEENVDGFIGILENEALTLHALMMSSSPSFVLLKSNSLKIIELIKLFRQKSGIKIGFTIDAGPNIHLIYNQTDQNIITSFIKNEIYPYLENGLWLDDEIGYGPKRME